MKYSKVAFLSFVIFFSTLSYSAVAFLTGSYTSGYNKMCIYDHMGEQYVMTISTFKFCPFTVQL